MALFEKVTKSNFKPSFDNGRFFVRSKQFNDLVEALQSVISDTGVFLGNITGNVTGNLTGNVTGNITGNSTGIHTGVVVLPQVTVAALGAVANAVNTTGKVLGKTVYGGNGRIYVASGALAASVWNASDGASDITPA
jgi:hypothetical protein